MHRSAKIALYSLFTVAVVLFFLYALFPSDLVRDYIVAKLSQSQPDLQLEIEKVSPVLPLGLELTPLTLSYRGTSILQSDRLTARLALSSMFKPAKHITFKASAGGGFVDGKAEWLPANERALNKLFIHVVDTPLETLTFMNQLAAYKPSGRLNLYIDFDRRRGGAGSATIQLDLSQAGLTLEPPRMGLSRVEFSQVRSEMNLTQRMLQIKQFEASGPQLNGKILGSVLFRRPLGDSRLTLSCTLKPEPAFAAEHKNDPLGGLLGGDAAQKRGLFFRITGTLDNPNYLMR